MFKCQNSVIKIWQLIGGPLAAGDPSHGTTGTMVNPVVSELLAIRTRLEGKFMSCYNLLNHCGVIEIFIKFVYLATFYAISFC